MLRAAAMLARAARAVGLGSAFAAARDGADTVFLRAGRPPFSASIDGVRVRGYLKHRSFLDEAAQPGTTYRELFVRTLRPGLTVVDGGAHLGLYTVLGARGVGPAGRVLAFEPDPYNLRALEFNTRGLANVVVSSEALADAPGQATFHRSSGTIGSSLLARDSDIGTYTTQLTSIDEELAGADLRGLVVKLNVEGAEPRVLEGARETLARCDDATLFVEISPDLLGGQAAELVPQLEELGFDVFRIKLADQSLRRVLPEEPPEKGHVLAKRAGADV
ncbi:MAG: FkbM family methyltransferase [Thermoleophilia bacterium]